jgi:hypothetical protein
MRIFNLCGVADADPNHAWVAANAEVRGMMSVLIAGQLIACAGLIFIVVVLSWRAGERFWSR